MPRFLKVAFARKHDGTVVTEADIASQAALARELRQVVDVPLLGEEMSDAEQEACWAAGHGMECGASIRSTAPPISSTAYRICRVGGIHAQWPAGNGVIYNPAMDEMYYALKGHGAFQWRTPAAEEFRPADAKCGGRNRAEIPARQIAEPADGGGPLQQPAQYRLVNARLVLAGRRAVSI